MQLIVKSEELKGKVGDSEVVQSVHMMDLESETREISSENSVKKEKYGGQVHVDLEETSKSNLTSAEKLGESVKGWSCIDLDAGRDNGRDMLFESGVVSEGDSSRNQGQNDVEVRSSAQLNGNDGKITNVDKFDVELKSRDNDDDCNRKRKRQCFTFTESLNWVRRVAEDPCNIVIGSLPEMSKWKYFGTVYPWMQLLLVRQAMMVERNDEASIVQSIWQKKQMMHPAMYEDYSMKRRSQRIVSAKTSRASLSLNKSQAQHDSLSTASVIHSDLVAGLWLKKYSHKTIPLDIDSQADIPEWTEKASDTDSKWLGTRIWPQEIGVDRNCLMERDPTGFGRRDLCGCEFKGSFECVRLHVSEEKIRIKLELGVAFYQWHIHKMGEEVASSWNKEEELKFEAIIKSNPPSQSKKFWKELCRYFHYKNWEQLVSYYFNVFLHRRRGLQNRSTPVEISSDDDDMEFETTTN